LPENGINTYNENPLHAALKAHYAGPDGAFEVPVDGYIADLVQDGVLVEIQTANFGAMRRKLTSLMSTHPVRLVHPIAAEKWIVRLDPHGETLGRRKSPKRGRWEQVFTELVAFPQLMREPNFTLAVAMIQEEEVRIVDGKRRRRGKDWKRSERRLLEVVDQRLFLTPGDLLREIPDAIPTPFTTADLAAQLSMPRWLSQKMAYCLREMGAIVSVGKKRNAIQYVFSGEDASIAV
tara:strand:+ start:5527 stop:6231 length:705 start_codon:yes stop_codon:yes gene_type:complete